MLGQKYVNTQVTKLLSNWWKVKSSGYWLYEICYYTMSCIVSIKTMRLFGHVIHLGIYLCLVTDTISNLQKLKNYICQCFKACILVHVLCVAWMEQDCPWLFCTPIGYQYRAIKKIKIICTGACTFKHNHHPSPHNTYIPTTHIHIIHNTISPHSYNDKEVYDVVIYM